MPAVFRRRIGIDRKGAHLGLKLFDDALEQAAAAEAHGGFVSAHAGRAPPPGPHPVYWIYLVQNRS